MHECTGNNMNSFHFFLIFSIHVYILLFFLIKTSFKNCVHRRGGKGVLKKQNKTKYVPYDHIYSFMYMYIFFFLLTSRLFIQILKN